MKKFHSSKLTLFNALLPCLVNRVTCYCGRYLLCLQTYGPRPYVYQRPVIFDDKMSTRQRDDKLIQVNYYHWRHNAATSATQTYDVTPVRTSFNTIRDDGTVSSLGPSVDVRDGTLHRQDRCFNGTAMNARQVIVITFLLWERVWEVNVYLLRSFTDSPDLRVTNGIAFRPDKRLWTVTPSMVPYRHER